MKTKNFFLTTTSLLLTCVSSAATQDMTPPRLESITIAPTNIDTSAGSQTVLLTVRLSDELSGIAPQGLGSQAGAWAAFRSPVEDWAAPVLSVYFDANMRVSGNALDGVYTNSLTLPRYGHAGTWTLSEFDIADAVGNRKQMSFTDLRRLGFPTQFTVQGVDDRDPPSIVSASISPTTIDTSVSDRAIAVTVRLRDNLAGMDGLSRQLGYSSSWISFVSPSKGQHVGTGFVAENRVSGDQFDGVYTNTMWLPRYSEPGIWSLDSLVLIDAVGNQRRIDLAGALDLGLPVEFTADGTGDTSPAQLHFFDFFPQRIDTSSSNQAISFTVRLTDALSGMGNPLPDFTSWGRASANFVSPSKGQVAGILFNAWVRAEGADFDGVYTNTMILPRYSEIGVWTLQGFNVTDAVGNSIRLDGSDLSALGFPTRFAVGITPSLAITRQADAILMSWPAWASSFRLVSQTGLDQSPAWMPVGIEPVIIGEDAVVAITQPAGGTFYQLSEEP